MKKFVHLHLHSEYSVLDGVLFIDEIVDAALNFGMPAVALTDHGNLFGAIEFYKKATEKGIKPIIGMETYVTDGSMQERVKAGEIYHLTLLAENEEGYRNLLKISTESYLKGFYYKPRVDKEFLRQHSKGLIALSGCLQGELPRKILLGYDDTELHKTLESYLEIFGRDNFFLELQDIGLAENKIVNRKLLELSSKYNVKVVATNDVHFLKPKDKILQEIVLCIQTGTRLDDPKRMKIETEEIYFKSPEEMWAIFGELEEALLNTIEIANRVNLTLELDPTNIHLPHFDIPEPYSSGFEMLSDLAFKGLKERFKGKDIPQEYKERLEKELKVINELNFSMYFLIIWDLIREAKRRGIPVGPGRGSAVGSLVLYALGVTDVDPIKYNLLFERFLNPERVSPPDVDIDFADNRRDEMILYLREKYGESNVAQIITFGRAKAKQAIKDVARVMGLPYSESDKIAKTITETGSLQYEYETNPVFKELIDSSEVYKKVFEYARRIEGRVRNISTHAAGVVVAPVEIYQIAPLYRSEDEDTVTVQFDMKSLELLGLLKIDLLGLRTLTIVYETEKLVKQKDPGFSADNIEFDDIKTYKLLSEGETTGVFQLESEGFRNVLKRVKPEKIEDLIAILALYRPGPMKSGMLESFIRRKNGEERIDYIDERLKGILEETYGVIAYQEQVMLLASTLAGFSLGQADILRKAMGKKQKEVMEKMMESFVSGCVENGMDRERAEQIFNFIAPFAEYGFNKSHAAGYAKLAYITAYLKAHYPLEFIVANLNAEMNTQDAQEKIYKFLNEAKSLGFKVIPPSINRSDYEFRIEGGDSIRYGLGAIKNVGRAAVEEILKVRNSKGEFKSIEDFLSQIDTRKVNRKTLESLIKAGAFDEFFPNRKALLQALDELLQTAKSGVSTGTLFTLVPAQSPLDKYKDLPFTLDDIIYFERDSLGLYLSVHPLSKFPYSKFQPINTLKIKEELMDGDEVVMVGVISEISKKKNKNGEVYASIKISDFEGEVRGYVHPQLLKEKGELLKEDEVVLVYGRVSENGNGKELRVDDISPFKGVKALEIDLSGVDVSKILVDELYKLLSSYSRGSVALFIKLGSKRYLSEIRIDENVDFFNKILNILPREYIKAILS
ncbi:MAG: DNA polymerase III subunit alpha [candidate division WOR-3 bacterium]